MNLGFRVEASDGAARAGRFFTTHAEIATPVFMPVGTQATVKGVDPAQLETLGSRILLGNTFHLLLRPGHERIRALGGLHRFMGWPHAILTDSGGFQVFSLAGLRRVGEDGVAFRSPYDGSQHFLSPEKAMEVQEALGSDIAMPLDVCPGARSPRGEIEAAVERSLRWLERAARARRRPSDQALFGIVQGGIHADLRARSARDTAALGLDGHAIGGLAVGEGKEETYATISATLEHLPADRPRYLMGMGTPADLVEAVGRGVDMFDCVLPTRVARNAAAYTSEGRINLRNARFADDARPLDEGCPCPACRRFTRAYLRHLYVAREMLAPMLVTLHNLHFYLDTMDRLRQAISAQRFDSVRRELLARPGVAEGGAAEATA